MVPHGGTDTRVWREIEQLGTELRALSAGTGDDAVAGTRVASSVAIALDWDSWWAIEQPASPTSVSYLDVLFTWHRAFTSLGLVVDFVPADGDLSSYGVVVAPGLFVATDAQLENLVAFAESAGVLLVGFGTGITDEDLHVRLGGYLGEPLRRALGVVDRGVRPARGARPARDRRRCTASRRAHRARCSAGTPSAANGRSTCASRTPRPWPRSPRVRSPAGRP